ncbi:MAG: DNA (cytosine-5-)-methyltransferase [Deltaproteobacteria bacterium]|nr:DNA (cytosine-5-)-methyltransferase [Deltaproteobacteria bacterium]
MFDWWQPAPLSRESGLEPERLKYFSKLRRLWREGKSHKSTPDSDFSPLDEFTEHLREDEKKALAPLLPADICGQDFDFIDLFAGIGGLRLPFSQAGGRCILTCERDEYALKTYQANWKNKKPHHYVSDIRTLTQPANKKDCPKQHIAEQVPEHDLLLAGFPCQPFSIAGVSKKNALNRAHGFDCHDQGQLFFDIARILWVKQPPAVVLENVKNLASHNGGSTFAVIRDVLTRLPEYHQLLFGHRQKKTETAQPYWIADLSITGKDPKIIDARHFVPQHRERLVLLCIRADLADLPGLRQALSLTKLSIPELRPSLQNILDRNCDVNPRYTLSPRLWDYLQNYAKKHRAKGNGFGYGMIHREKSTVTRTLSARYYKDGSEILVSQDDLADDPLRKGRPRKLTPQECARLMGFSRKEYRFRIPVSDTRSYKQFGNSVVVPVFESVAALLSPWLPKLRKAASSADEQKRQ